MKDEGPPTRSALGSSSLPQSVTGYRVSGLGFASRVLGAFRLSWSESCIGPVNREQRFRMQRLVLIDDNANDLQVTRRFLERRGFIVTAVTSGEEGLREAQAITPDAFVVDYRMP